LFVSGMRAPRRLALDLPRVHELPDDELMDLLETLGAPAELRTDAELARLFLPLLRSDFKAASAYRYAQEDLLTCPISAWSGSEDPGSLPELVDEWRSETTADFRLRVVPGTHSFVHTSRDELLAGISADLARAPLAGGTTSC
jgi:medium-chain acyl-[acyl-carrier-protein] hydrolase